MNENMPTFHRVFPEARHTRLRSSSQAWTRSDLHQHHAHNSSWDLYASTLWDVTSSRPVSPTLRPTVGPNASLHISLAFYLKIKSNRIKYYIIVRPKVDQRAGQLCLMHIGITKTEKNRTKT